jgi:hypothetical protein
LKMRAQSDASSASIVREKCILPATVSPSPEMIPPHSCAGAAAVR